MPLTSTSSHPLRTSAKRSAAPTLRTAIQSELVALGSSLTVDNILDRATTQTCGGCHRQSNNVPLGGGLTWPASNFFVHIDRSSRLSSALTTVFLPQRKQLLEAFINARATGPDTVGITCP